MSRSVVARPHRAARLVRPEYRVGVCNRAAP